MTTIGIYYCLIFKSFFLYSRFTQYINFSLNTLMFNHLQKNIYLVALDKAKLIIN